MASPQTHKKDLILPAIDEQALHAVAREQAQRDLIIQSRWGGCFYFVGLIGMLILEPVLWQPLPPLLALVTGFALLVWYRRSLSLRVESESTATLYPKVSAAMFVNQVLWSTFACWMISQMPSFGASVGLLLGASSCYAAGTVMRTISDRRLQVPALMIFFVPQAIALVIFLPSLESFSGIGMMATFLFFVQGLGKGQSLTYAAALETAQRLQLQSTALEQARNEAMQGSQAKSRFLSHMSHEIRTPLQSIIGTAELLEHTLTDHAQLQHVGTLRHASRLLMGLINDILDFSKITSDSLKLTIAPFDLAALMENLYTIMQPIAANKGLQLRCEIARDVPRHLEGDQLRLQQILVNLLNNAVKFSHSGEIVWRVKAMNIDGTSLKLHCEIIDQGVGIAESDLERIFDQFTQVESFHGELRGTGLGLSICKRLVTLMQGEIGVKSELGKGSTFWFTLPLKISTVPTQTAPQPPAVSPAAPLRPENTAMAPASLPIVLIADDNDLNLELFRQFLTKLDCECHTVANGAEAVEAFSSLRPHLVFMDCNMPVLDGKAATRKIREQELAQGWPRIPIVALTALVQDDDVQDCLDAGMDDHLGKPLRMAEFHACCQKWLPRLQLRKPASRA